MYFYLHELFSFFLIKLDTTTPTIVINPNLPSSVTRGDDYAIIQTYTTSSLSGGSLQCKSDKDGILTSTSTKGLTTLGTHKITCTVTTGTGKTATATTTVQITWHPYTITNLVTNGSFENGISEWVNRNSSENWVNLYILDFPYIPLRYGYYAFRIQFNNTQSFARANYDKINNLLGHKIYAKVDVLIDYAEKNITPGLYLEFSNGPEIWSESSDSFRIWYDEKYSLDERNIWRSLSLYETATYNYLKIMLAQSNANTNGIMLFDGLLVVDLTETFGAGNEPNQEWCDNHITYFDNSTTIYK